jgi:hypothetical protein
VRSDQRGDADGDGLDQVLAAERQQAAGDERNVARAVVGEHLAERIAEHDAGRRTDRRVRAAARVRHPALVEQRGDRVEALRVARDDDDQRRRRQRIRARERIEQQRFLAIARRREHQHGSVRTEQGAQRSALMPLRGRYGDIELQVAGDDDVLRTQIAQAARIGFGLRGDSGNRTQQRSR